LVEAADRQQSGRVGMDAESRLRLRVAPATAAPLTGRNTRQGPHTVGGNARAIISIAADRPRLPSTGRRGRWGSPSALTAAPLLRPSPSWRHRCVGCRTWHSGTSDPSTADRHGRRHRVKSVASVVSMRRLHPSAVPHFAPKQAR